eukprot:GHRR01036442.1.p1 GENE.GHRR01036442.1~~GHRR01036442.1.p1  ORF type:complete len:177 (-),score=31.39 GHRR01036442.1:133-663(-)
MVIACKNWLKFVRGHALHGRQLAAGIATDRHRTFRMYMQVTAHKCDTVLSGSRLQPHALLRHKSSVYWSVSQEIVGLGLANFAGSAFNAYTTTGSFSRSAVNFDSGELLNPAVNCYGGEESLGFCSDAINDLLQHVFERMCFKVLFLSVHKRIPCAHWYWGKVAQGQKAFPHVLSA